MGNLAERLKACREEMGFNQAQLAQSAGLKNQSIIGMFETGARKQSSHLPAIAAALGVAVLWLQYGQGSKRTDGQPPAEHPPLSIAPTVRVAPPELSVEELILIDGYWLAEPILKGAMIATANSVIERLGHRKGEPKKA